MTDLPYTESDLRTEAARQHHDLTEDPDFVGVGEQMDGTEVPSLTTEDEPGVVEGSTWDEFNEEQFDAALRSIHDLINGAANVSEWAVDLGADELQPSTEHTITVTAGRPIARIHFAFEPDMPDDMRTALVEGIGDAIANAL